MTLDFLGFVLAAAVSLASSWVLVSRIERMGGRLGVTDAMLGLLAALAADAPEITAAVSALVGHQREVGAGVVVGSNVFNLAALLGLGAVAAGWVALHRRVVVLTGAVSMWIAAVCVLAVLGWVPAAVAFLLVLFALGPYVWLAASHRRSRVGVWLSAAMGEEELELAEAFEPNSRRWDLPVALTALSVVVVASVVMERVATRLGQHFTISGIVVGAIVLAAVTSLPNAVAAVYLARRGRGAAMLSTALNSNALNIAVGLLLPATFIGLGMTSSREVFVSVWFLALTGVILALAYRDHGLRRRSGIVILIAYALFVVTLVAVAHGDLSALVFGGPAVLVVTWSAVLSLIPARKTGESHLADDRVASNGKQPQGVSSLAISRPGGWSGPRLTVLGCVLVAAIAAIDGLLGPRVILVGLLIVGPCCGVLTRRGMLAALTGLFALAGALAVAIPDGIWLTWTQLAFTLAIAIAAFVATAAATAMERSQRRFSG
jgi:cation:H+ antiporter